MSSAGEAVERTPDATARHQPLLYVLIAACGGILLDRYFPLPILAWCLVAAALLLSWVIAQRRTTTVAAVLVLAAILALAGTRHHWNWYLFEHNDIGRFAGTFPTRVALRVEATDAVKYLPAPDPHPLRTMPTTERSRLEVRCVAIRDGNAWRTAAGSATLLVDGHLADIHPGDQLQVFGRILRPPPANNPGEFDFAAYRRTQGQLCVLRADNPACVTTVATGNTWDVSNMFGDLRAGGNRLLWSYLDHERAGLAAAVLLGERDRLEHDRTEAFVETGTIHLLAISGLHVGILVSVLILVFRLGWGPRSWNLIAIALLTVFYALLTDARPPVMRAAVLIVSMCLAMGIGRRQLGFNTLAFAALVVLLWNPGSLFRVGAQLSFLAVATLICLSPFWRRRQQRDQEPLRWLIASTRPLPVRAARVCWRWFEQLTLAGFAVWLVALPLVMHHFHLFSPSGVLLTPLLYIPIAIVLASGLGVLLLGWICPWGAEICGYLCDWNLAILEWVVSSTRSLPFSFTWVAGPPLWWLIVFYLSLALWALLPGYRPKPLRCLALLAVWTVVGLWAVQPTKGELRCTFIAVGQGCSALIELPDGRAVLYDAGKMGSPESATRAISSVLWSTGRTHIDALVVSHADADHFNAIPELLERFSVGVVYVSPAMRRDEIPSVTTMYATLENKAIPLDILVRGDRVESGGATLEVLHPTSAGVEETHHGSIDNANSVVLAVEYQGRRILLTGDVESAGLESVLSEPALDCDVILAPHHGSPNSQPERLAAWSRPEWTVVISGLNDVPRRVSEAYRGQGSKLLHTGEAGAVQVMVRNGEIALTTQRP